MINAIWTTTAILLVILNGFFVAAEFALVKVRHGQIEALVRNRRPFAKLARWFVHRLDSALSACQLGITMASLALGWIGEPAVAHLVEPILGAVGVTSPTALHGISFVLSFTVITAAHLVLGEQAPKIFAIRRPERMLLWCAAPLLLFYVLLYPFLVALTAATSWLLRLVGIDSASEHDTPHSEDEIRLILSQAHAHGELTRSEHRLLDAVFHFDDTVCRRVMVPRTDVEIMDVGSTLAECVRVAARSRHTRFPVCDGSLDRVLGVLHIKDLIGADDAAFNVRAIMRPPRYVPETLPISRLLRDFQATRQHLAFVVDEYGTVGGIVTLENVIEQIVGPVEDEFDVEVPEIVPDGPGRFIVLGAAGVDLVNRALELDLPANEADTISGLLTGRAGHILAAGERFELDGAAAEVLEVKNARATRVRLKLPRPDGGAAGTTELEQA